MKRHLLLFLIGLMVADRLVASELHFATELFPPFIYVENGRPAGPLVEVAETACRMAGRSCTIAILPWRRAFRDAEFGRIDGFFPLVPTPERRERLFLTRPVARSGYGFFVLKDSAWNFDGPASLDGRTIAVFGPSGTLTVLEGLIVGSRTARIEVEVSNELVLNKLQGERYGPPGVAFVNRDVAASIMESQKLDKVRWAGNGPPVDLVLGFSRANVSAETSEAFDKAIAEMKESGQLKEIFLRHKLGENIPE